MYIQKNIINYGYTPLKSFLRIVCIFAIKEKNFELLKKIRTFERFFCRGLVYLFYKEIIHK